VKVIAQGKYVADSLKDYLHRHPEIDDRCTKDSSVRYFTTDSPGKFQQNASIFLNAQIHAEKTTLTQKR
jgi:glutamate racemase